MTDGTKRAFETAIEAAIARHDGLDPATRAAVLTQHANQLRTETATDADTIDNRR